MMPVALAEHGGDEVGGDGRLPHVAQDAGLHHLGDAPLPLADEHRQGDLGVIPEEGGVHKEQLFEGEVQAVLPEFQEPQHDEQLYRPGDQGSHRRTYHPKLGEAEVAVDEAVVSHDVDAQGGGGDDIADAHDADGAQGGDQDVGDAEEGIGEAHHPEVAGPLGDDRLLVGEQAQQELRGEEGRGEQEHGHDQADAQGDADDVGDDLDPPLAPVLGSQHHRPLPGAYNQHLEQELDLVAQAGARHGHLAVSAHHHIVRQVHAVRQQILQGDGEGEQEKGAEKLPVLNHAAAGRPPRPPPGWWRRRHPCRG